MNTNIKRGSKVTFYFNAPAIVCNVMAISATGTIIYTPENGDGWYIRLENGRDMVINPQSNNFSHMILCAEPTRPAEEAHT